MKNNRCIKLILVSLFLVSICISASAYTLKIKNIAPSKKIMIGSAELGVDDTFDSNDIIHWNAKLEDQQIQIICVKDCDDAFNAGKKRTITKKQFRKNTSNDISFELFNSCITKGANEYEEDPFVLWNDEYLCIEDVDMEEEYDYYCRVNDENKNINLIKQDGRWYLNCNDFKSEGPNLLIKIYKKNKTNNIDIQKIKEINAIQQIQ